MSVRTEPESRSGSGKTISIQSTRSAGRTVPKDESYSAWSLGRGWLELCEARVEGAGSVAHRAELCLQPHPSVCVSK